MCSFKNKIDQYGLVAIVFHWVLAILILGQIFGGWYMNEIATDSLRMQLIGWHKQNGVLILVLVTLRVFWRSINIAPSLNALPCWERLLSRSVHWLLYILMFAVPLSGWLMSSAKGYPTSFFGLFDLPNLIAPDKALGHQFKEWHVYMAYTLLAVIVLHVAGALKHHFIDKDRILRRMLR